MAGYVFDIRGSGSTQDDTGTECSDDAAPRKLAIRTLPDMAREQIPKDGDEHQLMALVTNEVGGRCSRRP